MQRLLRILLILFVLFYPMLVSIYVLLPLFVGIMGYIIIVEIEKGNIFYFIVASLYLVNMEFNLSLPLLLVFIAILFVYAFIYPYFIYFIRCKVCISLLTVLTIDLVYLVFLLIFDFIFQTNNIILDSILFYSLIVDLLVAVIL
ncbi:MAG: hypothetical protein LGB62_05520 [Sulfurovum sp.]|nr:hypothetical protein [Sulfurovum sp.]MCB4780653.1 hypothetical protein [Sulfurovum sp.]